MSNAVGNLCYALRTVVVVTTLRLETKMSAMGIATAELNSLAAAHFAGEKLENHIPSRPAYWFNELAATLDMGDLDLSAEARKLFGYCDHDGCYACASGCPDRCTHR